MRGLTTQERAVLAHMTHESDVDHWLDIDDDDGEEIRDRLVAQGRVSRVEYDCIDDDDLITIEWKITDLGRLALKVIP